MRKNIFAMAVMMAALIAGTTSCANKAQNQEKAENGVNDFRIKRGTNISHWLSQSEQRGEARRLHIQEDDFARLEQLGFDFVRSHRGSAHHSQSLFQRCERGRQGG